MKHFISIFLFSAIIMLMGCNTLEDLTKTPNDRDYQRIGNDWTVDSLHVMTYRTILAVGQQEQNVLIRDTLLPGGMMKFLPIGDAAIGIMRHEFSINGVAKTDEIHWSPNPGTGSVGVKELDLIYFNNQTQCYCNRIRYDVTELTDKSLRLYRYENLVSDPDGQKYGELKTIIKLHR